MVMCLPDQPTCLLLGAAVVEVGPAVQAKKVFGGSVNPSHRTPRYCTVPVRGGGRAAEDCLAIVRARKHMKASWKCLSD
ncbi:hypothetical protein E2C01_010016 [Portunus trituberculatus]|uniref:Uncharacterized protein n=1 Tax=Portunus trituberculatus TaxID=210409 RepID=A0A5B7D7A6_PORTR|nr:hypothetical protein [Portunus trituberculatus]